MSNIKFFYNGIKVNGGKLQKAYISESFLHNFPAGTITIYARNYERFSAEVRAAFTVQNNTDSMTDYFENDTIRVTPDHALYAAVKAAADQGNARRAARNAKRA